MKWFHTADWHLGKRVQGVYMTEDQRIWLQRFIECVDQERPDVVIIAGDLYDRAVPPTEAVELLDEVLETIVIDLKTPVIAITGNHDSPDRLEFGTALMKRQGLYLCGTLQYDESQQQIDAQTVRLSDQHGDVYFHLVPYVDPAFVRLATDDDTIRSHDDAMRIITETIIARMDPQARHVFVGHAFVTPNGEHADNTSDSERPLSIGGAEQIRSEYFARFHYTALGHLHRAHRVGSSNVYYAGSPLAYSISEESHEKGFYVVEMDGEGKVSVEQRSWEPARAMRRVEATIEEIATHERSDDYVYVTLLNESPVLYPMEKVRATYPNALHVERRVHMADHISDERFNARRTGNVDPIALFANFYQEVHNMPLTEQKEQYFSYIYNETLKAEGERR